MITVTNLRKIFTEQGIKGFAKARREEFDAYLDEAWVFAIIEDTRLDRKAAAAAAAEPKKGICEDCGRKVGKSGHPTLCDRGCFDYAGWENTHSDEGHENGEGESQDDCPVCHPELDPRSAKPSRKSRAGMVIVAKGTEVHKSQTFKAAAEAAGWKVTVTGEHIDEDGNGRYYADAYRGEDAIQLAWDGRAYDYSASSALIKGKNRKIRNLKEALRVLAAS